MSFDPWNASRSGESYDGRYTSAPGCSYRERLRGKDSPGHEATGAEEAPREQPVAGTACHGAEDAPEEPMGGVMTKDEKLTLCSGCRDNYYNRPGNSLTGECWLLKEARKVTRMQVGVWQNPPYRWRPQETLHCHKPDGAVWINRDDPRVVEPNDDADRMPD